MARRVRLDLELVRRGLAPSREAAAAAISAGRVRVGGQPTARAATAVAPDTPVTVADPEEGLPYASRGGGKLAAGLRRFAAADPPLKVEGRRALDAGASTGGFTDALLRAGASGVVAVDVGYGQLAWRLRTDPRVRVLDRTNVRTLTAAAVGGPVDVVVADLSFISLRLVLPALHGCAHADADFLVLVKPQFEVGRDRLGRGGVVRDPQLRGAAVRKVAATARELGLGVRGVLRSPLPGPAGNVEILLWLHGGGGELEEAVLAEAVRG
jgi:23S rRNA (cytidine1920-2'-O)/16S rRNA (cytidine1409-2'-O)-methyltransferase